MAPQSNVVRISDIDLSISPKEVKIEVENLLSKDYKSFAVSIVKPRRRNTRLAFVEFKSSKDAAEMVEKYHNGLQLFGNIVRVAIDRSDYGEGKGEYSHLIDEVHTLISKLTDDDRDQKPSSSRSHAPRDGRRPGQTLYVGNLNRNISKKDLLLVFEKFGFVDKIIIHNQSPSNTFAFVKFFNLFMAKKALRCMKDKKILGIKVTCNFAKSIISKYLWIGGLGPWVDPILLRKKLEEFGEIERLEWPTNKNFAYVEFSDVNSATRAMEKLWGSRLGKRKLYLDYSDHSLMTSDLNYSDTYLGGDSNSEDDEAGYSREYDHKYNTNKLHALPQQLIYDEDKYYRRHPDDEDDYHRSRDISPSGVYHENRDRKNYTKESPFDGYPVKKHRDDDVRREKDYFDDVMYNRRNDEDDFRDSRDFPERPVRDPDIEYYPSYHDDERSYRDKAPVFEDKYRYDEKHVSRKSKRDDYYHSIDDVPREKKNDRGIKCTIKNDLCNSSIRDDDSDHSRSFKKRKEDSIIVDVPPSSKKRSLSKDSVKYGESVHHRSRTNLLDRNEYSPEHQPADQYQVGNFFGFQEENINFEDGNSNNNKHEISTTYDFNPDKAFIGNRKISPLMGVPFAHNFNADVSVAKELENKLEKVQNTRIKYIIPRVSPAFTKSQNINMQALMRPTSSAVHSLKNNNLYSPIDFSPMMQEEESQKRSYLNMKYPLVWRGAITLKTSCYWTDVRFISGAISLVHRLMDNPSKTADEKVLKITQRLRLDMPHTMEELERRINSVGRSGSCVLIAGVPTSINFDPESTPYSELPLSKLCAFLKETQFAAVVSLIVEDGGDKDQSAKPYKGLLHIFPVCDISLKFLREEAPDLVEEFRSRDELLMILIKDTENN
ncbi:hypothetical protein HELRODRAFT_192189 [Helobdella robusta]|uniref:RRM domain-containing protein n=1 Tax=Helobdella robusta TaxID=6412 RepID=T1FTN9_HELRO|nr:hypothetical protein HELRODRAFT_192189 [Helobdella robusta]ESO01573.1 hypothetical protein HELRODRAFT_192189 [Helobdella robusta]